MIVLCVSDNVLVNGMSNGRWRWVIIIKSEQIEQDRLVFLGWFKALPMLRHWPIGNSRFQDRSGLVFVLGFYVGWRQAGGVDGQSSANQAVRLIDVTN